MTNQDIKYLVGFSLIPLIRRVKFSRLKNHCGKIQETWRTTLDKLSHAGLDKGIANAIINWRPKISPEEETTKLELKVW